MGGMLPQENFDMRVLLRPSETAITTQLYGRIGLLGVCPL